LSQASDTLKVYDMLSNTNKAILLKDVALPEVGSIEVSTGEPHENIFLIKFTSYTTMAKFF